MYDVVYSNCNFLISLMSTVVYQSRWSTQSEDCLFLDYIVLTAEIQLRRCQSDGSGDLHDIVAARMVRSLVMHASAATNKSTPPVASTSSLSSIAARLAIKYSAVFPTIDTATKAMVPSSVASTVSSMTLSRNNLLETSFDVMTAFQNLLHGKVKFELHIHHTICDISSISFVILFIHTYNFINNLSRRTSFIDTFGVSY